MPWWCSHRTGSNATSYDDDDDGEGGDGVNVLSQQPMLLSLLLPRLLSSLSNHRHPIIVLPVRTRNSNSMMTMIMMMMEQQRYYYGREHSAVAAAAVADSLDRSFFSEATSSLSFSLCVVFCDVYVARLLLRRDNQCRLGGVFLSTDAREGTRYGLVRTVGKVVLKRERERERERIHGKKNESNQINLLLLPQSLIVIAIPIRFDSMGFNTVFDTRMIDTFTEERKALVVEKVLLLDYLL